ELATPSMDEVTQTDAVAVAGSPGHNPVQVGVCKLGPFRDGECPTVDRVEAVRGEEVRQVTRASDAGHDEDVPRLQLKGVNRRLERAQDGAVSAPWAPRGLDPGLVRVNRGFSL